MERGDNMNLYETKLFTMINLRGPNAGDFTDAEGVDVNQWMQEQVMLGYALMDLKPVAYGAVLYLLATMELVWVIMA